MSAFGCEFERVVGRAGVAVGERSYAEKNIVRDFDAFVAEAAFFVGEGATKKLDDLRSREWFEDVNLGAGEKRRNDFKGRIFRGRADEGDVAGFDVRKKSVLLGFVEAVDFVDEDDGAVTGARFVFCGGHDVLDFLDAGENGTEGNEIGVRQPGDDAREGGLAAAGRAPEKH